MFILMLTTLILPAMAISNEKYKNCGDHKDPGLIAQCAGSQYSTGIITDLTFASYLNKALDELPHHTMAYSLGVTTGTQQEVFAGKIKDPSSMRNFLLGITQKIGIVMLHIFTCR